MPVRTQERRFEQQAERILGYLRNEIRYDYSFLPRPFFIEFTGSPSAGKTTTITELDKFLRRHGFRVYRPQEGAEVIRHIERTTPLYNIRTCDYARQILVDNSVNHTYDVVLFDRCIFDGYCWMMYWEEKGLLTPELRAVCQQFFLLPLWTDCIDLAYFMICDPEKAMGRELKIALSTKLGETTNPETIRRLVGRYREAYRQLHASYPQLSLVDTTDLDEHTMIEMIATKTLDALEQKVRKRKERKR